MKTDTKSTAHSFLMDGQNIKKKVFSTHTKSHFFFTDSPQKYKSNSFESFKFNEPEVLHDDWSNYMERFSAPSLSFVNHNAMQALNEFIKALPKKFKTSHWSWYFSDLSKTIDGYMRELHEGDRPMSPPSGESLNYFLRYLPHFADTKGKSYIDRSTGCFGVIVCKNFNILDIQVRKDSDLIFSYATPGTQKNFPSFSGEATIIDSSDAKQIRKILRIVLD
ncbi:hypothetical protein N5D79_08410 [Pseudomonas sp. GD03817]|uniref:hypothetical protein n=1 Tax=unclassified Pseudomonas TaxID=196821 RepID=UPI002449F66A|nr:MULTISPECIES: hypothetical protein [unclassified Pseudomonas]MDH1401234.1 hypothetical protein [Pseudomonas sp. GD03730]MDH1774898.1 hypothetical protein [Pseudomonas sp. GD03817]